MRRASWKRKNLDRVRVLDDEGLVAAGIDGMQPTRGVRRTTYSMAAWDTHTGILRRDRGHSGVLAGAG